jgi:hypothetical protein
MKSNAWVKKWVTDTFSLTVTYPPEEDLTADLTADLEVFDSMSSVDLELLEDCISETVRGEFVNPVA